MTLITTWLLKSNILPPNSLNKNVWAPWKVNLIPVLEKKNHMGLQRKANKPDCGAQPVEQLLFCPCGKFPDSSHQPTPPKNHYTVWRTISPSRSKRSLTLCKRSRSFPILIIFLPSLHWNNTYIKTIQTKGQFRQVRWNRHVRSIMQKYTKVMQILMQNEYRQWRQWFPIKIERHLQRMPKK